MLANRVPVVRSRFELTLCNVGVDVRMRIEVVVEGGGSSLSGPHHKERRAARI